MRKTFKKLFILPLALLVVMALGLPVQAYELHDGPTGLTKFVKGKTWGDYVLFAPTVGSKTTYLIDLEGNVVHTWQHKYPPGLFARLLPNGNLLRASQLPDPVIRFGGVGGLIEEIDWNGKVVWSYKMFSDKEIQHHAFDRMPNGNTLILGWERITNEQMLAKGRRPDLLLPKEGIKMGDRLYKDFWLDFAREVDKKGKTVWEWHAYDHVGLGPDKLNPNQVLPKPVGLLVSTTDWTHFNTLEYVPQKDCIIMNSRNMGETFLVDKKSGKIVWRWGNPAAYGHGKAPSWFDDGDQELFGSHHATYLDNGNIQIFDNGSERPEGSRSRVVEVNPETNQIVWQYKAYGFNSFYSHRQGSAQRLPNGNVFVTSTNNGHLFEVTPEGDVVWEFVNPIMRDKPSGILADKECVLRLPNGTAFANSYTNMVHRAYRYSKNDPAFKGKKLTPKGYIVEGWPRYIDVYKPLSK